MADFAYQAPDQSNAYGPDAGIGPRPKAGLDRLRQLQDSGDRLRALGNEWQADRNASAIQKGMLEGALDRAFERADGPKQPVSDLQFGG